MHGGRTRIPGPEFALPDFAHPAHPWGHALSRSPDLTCAGWLPAETHNMRMLRPMLRPAACCAAACGAARYASASYMGHPRPSPISSVTVAGSLGG